jgi:hypothetical protein
MMGVLEMTLPTSWAWVETHASTAIKPASKLYRTDVFFIEDLFAKYGTKCSASCNFVCQAAVKTASQASS